MSLHQKNSGQAMIEYLLLVVFLLLLSLKMVGGFTDFMRDSIGNLGHVLSVNLTTGICKEECFFDGYRNGFKR
jgi:hypothetical protein